MIFEPLALTIYFYCKIIACRWGSSRRLENNKNNRLYIPRVLVLAFSAKLLRLNCTNAVLLDESEKSLSKDESAKWVYVRPVQLLCDYNFVVFYRSNWSRLQDIFFDRVFCYVQVSLYHLNTSLVHIVIMRLSKSSHFSCLFLQCLF